MKQISVYTHTEYDVTATKCTVKEAQEYLACYNKFAVRVMKETDADHIVYGRKVYDKDDELVAVHLYMAIPMTDEMFYARVENISDSIVYAIHNNNRKRNSK